MWKKGKRELEGFSSQDADDQGSFRIAQLPPGRYYVVAIPDSSWENRNRAASAPRNQPTWYPSSSEAQSATAVVLRAGEERRGIDIRLRRSPFFRIRGKLTGPSQIPSGNEPEPFSRPRLSAVPISDQENGAVSYTGSLRPDGAFEFPAVPAGPYEVRVARGFMSTVVLGHTTLRVDDQDVENVAIDLVPPHPVKGTAQIEGNGLLDPTGLFIWLDSIDGEGGFRPAPVRENGSFDFPQVSSEMYRVRLSGTISRQVYLKLLRHGHTDSMNGTFSAATEEPLTLILSTHGARLTWNFEEH